MGSFAAHFKPFESLASHTDIILLTAFFFVYLLFIYFSVFLNANNEIKISWNLKSDLFLFLSFFYCLTICFFNHLLTQTNNQNNNFHLNHYQISNFNLQCLTLDLFIVHFYLNIDIWLLFFKWFVFIIIYRQLSMNRCVLFKRGITNFHTNLIFINQFFSLF